ncbi:UrcA family protein [Pontixanthobacter aquaemixtae]|uniref:UrcA family protein n=1 Tax=Pontixanthobacter aquaemixtae TaxID=1958940 RepID=A0A844ZVE4_9SPHN|nr:UrcA family protein [Pontixanthobacter aquaemixtae]MXO91444.1 UrcA family protein [Pontixanthobacter aquaemixtae]
MRKSLITLAAISAACTAAPAFADSISIQYRDLNLSTAEGQAKLEQRIDRAAKKVCKLGDHTMGTRISDPSAKACYAKAKKQASRQMAAVVQDRNLGG